MMTSSREALYNIVMALGPVSKTKRDDNTNYEESKIRDSVEFLQEFIEKYEPYGSTVPDDIGYEKHFEETYNPEHHVPDHCKCKGEDCGRHNNVPHPNGVGRRFVDGIDIEGLQANVVSWHHARNLIEGSTDKDQFCKLLQEVGELSESICKGRDVADDIGDIIVVLINIAERNALDINDCLIVAWEDIKYRKGRMIDGVFVKETDWT